MSGISQPRPWQAERMRNLPPEQHPRWKGDKVGYRGIHSWVQKNFGKADRCDNLNCTHPDYHRFEWANLNKEYRRLRSEWIRLCVYCHRQMDKQGIMPKLANVK